MFSAMFPAGPAIRSSSSCCATARRSTLNATPELDASSKDALGNKVKVGVIGVVNRRRISASRG